MLRMMEVECDGNVFTCKVEEDAVVFIPKTLKPDGSSVDIVDNTLTLTFDDIIAIKREDITVAGLSECTTFSTVIHYIKKVPDDPKWSHQKLHINSTPDKEADYQILLQNIQPKFDKVVESRPKKLVVLMNPIGGKRQAKTLYESVMTPLFELTNISCELIVSERPKHLIEVMETYDYKSVDGIVMMGGDGTFTEIINALLRRTQKEAGVDYNDPEAKLHQVSTPLAIMPTGTGNGVSEGLYGCQDVLTATLHVIKGKVRTTRILGTYADKKLVGYSGCISGLGLAAEMIYIVDNQFRWMRAFRYLAIPFIFTFRGIRHVETEITLNKRKTILVGDGADQRKEFVYEEEKLDNDTSMVMVWPFSLLDDNGKFNLYKSCVANVNTQHRGDMFIAVYKCMGLMQLFQHFYQLYSKKENVFESSFTEVHRAQSINIRYKEKPNSRSVYNRLVSIDGEIQECQEPDFLIKILEGTLKVFSCNELV